MSHEDNDPWSFTSTIRNYPNADAKYVLEKNGLRRIAERLCEQFNLRKVMDLCELTDDVIDRITWLETVPRQKLKRYCAICRQRQIETNKPRTSHTTTWTSHTSTVTGQNGDLQPLLESLKGLSNPLPAAPLCRSTRSISAICCRSGSTCSPSTMATPRSHPRTAGSSGRSDQLPLANGRQRPHGRCLSTRAYQILTRCSGGNQSLSPSLTP